jgi:hypothetical protein
MILTVEYCPNCKEILHTFLVDDTFEAIHCCVKCNRCFIPKDFGEYTKKIKGEG